jgi:lipid-A-disaccharide synthase
MAQPGLASCAMVAGEASGDLLAAHLLSAMKTRWPQLRAFGVGGPALTAQGFEAWWPGERLAVRGYVEVLPRLPGLLRMRQALGKRILQARPALFIGIDAPDFNFGLEQRLRGAGVKTVHFVSPSFWAWRADKLRKLKAAADLVLCLFPFEPQLLQAHGIAARYVGHPLASVIPMQTDPEQARLALGLDLDPSGPLVALLPGSRASEVQHLAGRFVEAASIMHRARPALRFVLPAVPNLAPQLRLVVDRGGMGQLITVLDGRSHQALAACDLALVASGTATLEAALFKRPMVIAYHMNPLSWWIMQRKRLQPWVGLPNILSRDMLVPELLQEQASPAALAKALLAWLETPDKAQALRQKFEALHHRLRRDTAGLAVLAIEELCGPKDS